MAKAKGKKSSGKKTSLTKSLSKSARKSGLMDLLDSPLGRQILADALVAAAAAAAAALTKTRTVRKAGAAVAEKGAEAAEVTKDKTLDAADAVAGIVTEAARHFLPTSLVGDGDEQDKSSGKKVKYLHRTSDHSKRKVAKVKNKDEKGAKAEKR
ncbi:hypothetical protein [Microvirga roseola]|uniref:hypothetical protein n=1 Tax=Microvirga roseola TaxID=2883126 RepID=UPI001E40A2C1|nr:hypothetical protein [Microvirga roseola]